MGWPGIGKTVVAVLMLGIAVVFAAGVRRQPGQPARTAQLVELAEESSGDARADCGDLRQLVVPVKGVARDALGDSYGDARADGRRHDAIDIMAPLGQPVIAAAPGRVERLFLSRAGGNTVYVRAPQGHFVYYYAHLDHYAPDLHEGQALDRGDAIGAVGFSGNADPAAPHLHFAIYEASPGRKWWQAAAAFNAYPLLAGRRGEGMPGSCDRAP